MSSQRSNERPCIIGVQKCGCITYANSMPDDLIREDERAMAKIIRNGGSIERTTVADAHSRPDFMPMGCPHAPKGWERAKKEPVRGEEQQA